MVMQDNGATALIVASQSGHAEVVKVLLASDAAVNQGRTVSITDLLQTTERVFMLGQFELREGSTDRLWVDDCWLLAVMTWRCRTMA